MPSLKSMVRQEVLERSMGFCERCDRKLGSSYYFHYKGYRVLNPDNIEGADPITTRPEEAMFIGSAARHTHIYLIDISRRAGRA